MGKYGQVAIAATQLCRDGKATNPRDAWTVAAQNVFSSSQSSREKGCPRGAFLGLCEIGAVSGVPAGKYCQSKKNKDYAIKALSLLNLDRNREYTEDSLWAAVMQGVDKVPNHQMDVVLALWKHGLVHRV